MVAKLIHVLNPGVAELAGRHEAIVTQTMLNPRRTGLLRPSDIVLSKQKTDVLLVGVAYPPDSASFAATLTLGSPNTVMDPAETSSPVPLPELRASEQTFSPDSDFLGDIDPTAFQAAPRDSQSTALPYDCEVTLENLHQTHRLLHTTILRHKLVARLDDGPQGALTLTPDTIVFDTNASTCTVTFRGWRTLKNAPKTILVHVEATAVSGSHAAEHAQPPLRTPRGRKSCSRAWDKRFLSPRSSPFECARLRVAGTRAHRGPLAHRPNLVRARIFSCDAVRQPLGRLVAPRRARRPLRSKRVKSRARVQRWRRPTWNRWPHPSRASAT